MNLPPTEFIRVSIADLDRMVTGILEAVGVPGDHAQIMSDLMIDTDLRGVFSHGTQPLGGYYKGYQNGSINPTPDVRIVKESPVSVLVDGDGGLGHVATHMAVSRAIEKTREIGLCMAVSRSHAHFGSAGKYTRMIVKEGLVGFCVSGLCARKPEDPNTNAWAHYPLDNCPMSFGFPAREGYPVISDICSSVMDDWDVESERFKSIFEQMPAVVFRSLGLRAATNFLSAGLGGMMLPGSREGERRWQNAYYGAFCWILDPEVFVDGEAFESEIDRTADVIHELVPLPGYEKSYLPGGPEWEREADYRANGIPLGERHRRGLETAARELGVSVPW
ncbi:MAG: hypothetical protein HOH43_11405 [Candidatus Latescibacteria bacterium]|jgi:L-2-hydroxycarboxylate dehydrogenase (NAD+)|nr:hypothetical protein [Candidatus Latescibacterota bacterium]